MKGIHVCLSLVHFTLASWGRLRVAASSFTSDGLELTLLSPQPGQRWSGEPVQVHVDVDLGVGVTADRIRGNPAFLPLLFRVSAPQQQQQQLG